MKRDLKQFSKSELRSALTQLQLMVNQQAEDEGLWFVAQTAPEAYLQKQLRLLHQKIEHLTGAINETL